jgi:hypothetical protein
MLEQGWKDLLFLSSLSQEFKGLSANVVANESTWFDWYNLEVIWARKLQTYCGHIRP